MLGLAGDELEHVVDEPACVRRLEVLRVLEQILARFRLRRQDVGLGEVPVTRGARGIGGGLGRAADRRRIRHAKAIVPELFGRRHTRTIRR